MKRAFILCLAFTGLTTTAAGQIGKTVSVAAGTPEDKALAEIYSAPDGPEKVALLDKFTADFGSNSDMALLADQLYEQTYLAQKKYSKVYEYGDKTLTIDADNLAAAVAMVHAAEEEHNAERLFSTGEKVAAIIARYKSSPPPEGIPAEQWNRTKNENLGKSMADINYVEYALIEAAYKVADPAARAALLERYVAAFPDSAYTQSVQEQIPIAYQQANNGAKMMDAIQRVLATDPNNVAMLLLLADSWSSAGKDLDKAEADAQKALDLLSKAQKPPSAAEDQWKQQLALQQGLAYSSLGQIYVIRGSNAKAVDVLQKAKPLLKSDSVNYARNLYRLGFTLAKMQKIPEARAALTEAVSLDTPWKPLAQETLDKIGGAVAKRSSKKAS
jgi:tetratricopeptide (TPR) repeat protein